MTENRIAIRDLPTEDQPRYRANHIGVGALTNVELIQLVTSCTYLSTAQNLYVEAGSLKALATQNVEEMTAVDRLGPASATALQAAFELGRRAIQENDTPTAIRSPRDAYQALSEYHDKEQEHLVVISLDARSNILAVDRVYIGAVNGVGTRTGELFRPAIRHNAVAVIIGHNHPSGDPTPSPEDVVAATAQVDAGKLLSIQVLDHMIVAHSRYVSMRERGFILNDKETK